MHYSPGSRIILEVTDIYGTIVRFSKNNYDKHKDKHPELRNKQFCPGQIARALQKPTLVIQGYQEGTLCYYLVLFRIRDIIKYTKVVVQETDRNDKTNPHCVIKTAFKTDHVQECKYNYKPMYYNKK
jgi:hypothetical protein